MHAVHITALWACIFLIWYASCCCLVSKGRRSTPDGLCCWVQQHMPPLCAGADAGGGVHSGLPAVHREVHAGYLRQPHGGQRRRRCCVLWCVPCSMPSRDSRKLPITDGGWWGTHSHVQDAQHRVAAAWRPVLDILISFPACGGRGNSSKIPARLHIRLRFRRKIQGLRYASHGPECALAAWHRGAEAESGKLCYSGAIS